LVMMTGVPLALFGCAPAQPPAAPDTRAADEEAIRKIDAQWVKDAGEKKTVDAWMPYYTSDATVLPPNEPVQTTTDGIRKSLAGLIGLPGLSITWRLTTVEAAKSGELAYAYGSYDMSFDNKGKKVTDKGKILEIWKKQADGGWKCAVDTWNSDLPAAP
ncbi:MAG TPA: DUF4440 domain-containing protein, partial [Bryobacteraceae bacterium]|nr:DUF4440 domain-containing protein [Bryobacteraceae bacterium]